MAPDNSTRHILTFNIDDVTTRLLNETAELTELSASEIGRLALKRMLEDGPELVLEEKGRADLEASRRKIERLKERRAQGKTKGGARRREE